MTTNRKRFAEGRPKDLREPVIVLTESDEDGMRAKALLALVNEFRRCKDDSIKITDLCDTLNIYVYQETIACEQAANEFAREAAAAFPNLHVPGVA